MKQELNPTRRNVNDTKTRIHLDDLFDQNKLAAHLSEGNVTLRSHPELPLDIFNYTAKAQYERLWDDVTTACRGLIVQKFTKEVIARPFPKFFNLGEHDELPTVPPAVVHDKLDGSLGIAYECDGYVGIATSGSFASEQAIWASNWLHHHHPDWRPRPGATHLFEIIFPSNRIVVNYGNRAELVALTTLDTMGAFDMPNWGWPGSKVETFPPSTLERLAATVDDRTNHEGYVCVWPQASGPALRIKLKAAEYVRLHKIVTGLSNRSVWEHLSAGLPITAMAEVVPDEYHEWLLAESTDMLTEFANILTDSMNDLTAAVEAAGPEATRAEVAEHVKRTTYPGLCFGLLDGKNIDDRIWRMIRPERESPLLTVEA